MWIYDIRDGGLLEYIPFNALDAYGNATGMLFLTDEFLTDVPSDAPECERTINQTSTAMDVLLNSCSHGHDSFVDVGAQYARGEGM